MSEAEHKAAKVEGPRGMPLSTEYAVTDKAVRSISVIAVTTSTQVIDITGTGDNAMPRAASRMVKLNPEANVYYFWSDDASATLDETATGSTTLQKQCDILWSGQPVHEYASGRYLVVKGVAACKLRISVSSP